MIEVVLPGVQTTIQDGGRPGYLSKGIPPAGAQDAYSAGMAQLLVGNRVAPPPLTLGDPGDAGLEMLIRGPTLRFDEDAVVALTGANVKASVDGRPAPLWESFEVPAGSELRCTRIGPGARAYLAVAGGIDVPPYLGSRATFVRGRQGGLDGRSLREGDRLRIGRPASGASPEAGRRVREELRPSMEGPWEVRVVPGPQAHLFTEAAVELFFSATWSLSPTSDRMGFRFIGPALELRERPDYLIRDAGAGPADIVDDVTPVGGIQVPGGIEPIAMGVENPTAGGYAKIGTVISADLGVLGRIRPLEKARFIATELDDAIEIGRRQHALISEAALA